MQLEDKIGIIIIQICMALGVALKVESNDKASFPSIRETKAHYNNITEDNKDTHSETNKTVNRRAGKNFE